MRVAALYDIHGNLPALEAVLREIDNEKVDCLIIGGDVVAGPFPNETLALLHNITTPKHFILGNAESDVLRVLARKDVNGLSERANEEARWVAGILTPTHAHLLSSWKETLSLDTDVWGNILFCHGTPRSDAEIFTSLTPAEILVPVFESVAESTVICGHTHMQFDREIGAVHVINAGSVGMPFGRTGADWLLIDSEIKFKHTNYDIHSAAERICNSEYPHAEDFVENYVLQAPSCDKMLEMLTRMEAEQTK